VARCLLLLRHGKSDWHAGAATDFERPLAPRGRAAAERMGRWLAAEGLLPDLMVSSSAERARQTALRIARAGAMAPSGIRWEPSLYEADLDTLLDVLAGFPSEPRCLMLVGHNPGLQSLVQYLGGAGVRPPPGAKLMPTAAVATLKLPDEWDRLGAGCALGWRVTRPRELPD